MSQLLAWQPSDVAAAGQDLTARADRVRRCAEDLTSVGAALGDVWTGQAADAACAHTRRRADEVDQLAQVARTAGRALHTAAGQLAGAKASLRDAVQAAAAAGCTVSDSGLVTPPAMPPAVTAAPTAPAADRLDPAQAGQDGAAAYTAALAGRLGAQIQIALTGAGLADDAAAEALSALEPWSVTPPPVPVTMGPVGGRWDALPRPAEPECPGTIASPASPPAQAEDRSSTWSGIGHGVLDVAGLIPFAGEPADAINALWYLAEGDQLNAALSTAALVPVWGTGVTAAKIVDKADEAADAVSIVAVRPQPDARGASVADQLAGTWRRPGTLQDHFIRHGPDFNATSQEDYVAKAAAFLQRSKDNSYAIKVDPDDGTVRIYDDITDTFGSYTAARQIKTFYKPGTAGYWERQPGVLQ